MTLAASLHALIANYRASIGTWGRRLPRSAVLQARELGQENSWVGRAVSFAITSIGPVVSHRAEQWLERTRAVVAMRRSAPPLVGLGLVSVLWSCSACRPAADPQGFALGPVAAPIATTRLFPLYFQVCPDCPDAGSFGFDYLHWSNGGVAFTHVVNRRVAELANDAGHLATRMNPVLGELRGVGTTFSSWRSTIALMPREGTQGVDFLFRLPDRALAVRLASCWQTPSWSAGAVDAKGFWLAIDNGPFCGFCLSTAGHALIQYDREGNILSTACLTAPSDEAVLLHPTLRFGVVAKKYAELFVFDDGGITTLFVDPAEGSGRSAVYPLTTEQRVLVPRSDGGWQDLVVGDGGAVYVASAHVPPSVFLISSLSSPDGVTLHIVQPGSLRSEVLVTTRTETGEQTSKSVVVPEGVFTVDFEYHQGHLARFFMTPDVGSHRH